MQKLAAAIEEVAKYVEVLEKKAANTATHPASAADPVIMSPPNRSYGELLPKLAEGLDLEEDAVKTELDKLSNSVLSGLCKLAHDEDVSVGLAFGAPSDYVDPSITKQAAKTMSANEAWAHFTKYVLR